MSDIVDRITAVLRKYCTAQYVLNGLALEGKL